MIKIIISDIKSIFCSKRFWISVGLLIFLALINIIHVKVQFRINIKKGLDLFAYGNIFFPLTHYIAPYIPAFILGPLVVDEIQSVDISNSQMNLRKSIVAHSVSSLIVGSGIFIFSHIIMLVICFVFNPSMKAMQYESYGIFQEIYSASPPLYVILFILYSGLFGAIYGFFSIGIGLVSKSYWMAMALPGIVYYCARYLWPFFDNPLLSWAKFLPSIAYDFDSTFPLWMRVSELGAILLVSVMLAIIGYYKKRKELDKTSEDSNVTEVFLP